MNKKRVILLDLCFFVGRSILFYGKKSYFIGLGSLGINGKKRVIVMDFIWVGRPSFLNGNFILFYWAWLFSEGQEFMGKKRKRKRRRRNGEEKEKKKKRKNAGLGRPGF